jgi:hypothetical protein
MLGEPTRERTPLATLMKSFKYFVKLVSILPFFSFFLLSSIRLTFIISCYPFRLSVQHKVYVDSINNEARNVSFDSYDQVAIMDDCDTRNGDTSPNQL